MRRDEGAYALALRARGRLEEAARVLENGLARNRSDRDLLIALVTVAREHGRPEQALGYARALTRAHPDDPDAAALLARMQAGTQTGH